VLFVMSCIDKPDSEALRLATREAHLAYVRAGSLTVKLAGPYLTESGAMAGSLFIIEAPDRAAVETFSANDPYAKAGLFQSVDIRPFRVTVGALV